MEAVTGWPEMAETATATSLSLPTRFEARRADSAAMRARRARKDDHLRGAGGHMRSALGEARATAHTTAVWSLQTRARWGVRLRPVSAATPASFLGRGGQPQAASSDSGAALDTTRQTRPASVPFLPPRGVERATGKGGPCMG